MKYNIPLFTIGLPYDPELMVVVRIVSDEAAVIWLVISISVGEEEPDAYAHSLVP